MQTSGWCIRSVDQSSDVPLSDVLEFCSSASTRWWLYMWAVSDNSSPILYIHLLHRADWKISFIPGCIIHIPSTVKYPSVLAWCSIYLQGRNRSLCIICVELLLNCDSNSTKIGSLASLDDRIAWSRPEVQLLRHVSRSPFLIGNGTIYTLKDLP